MNFKRNQKVLCVKIHDHNYGNIRAGNVYTAWSTSRYGEHFKNEELRVILGVELNETGYIYPIENFMSWPDEIERRQK